MKNLLNKEIRLAMHPTNLIFLTLSALVIIPNYPYYVTFFYTALGLFFLCLNGRENHDIEYSMTLPVRKRQLVKARIGFAVILEMLQFLLVIPLAMLKPVMSPEGNAVGMDANLAFFGLSLLMMGLFNYQFFTAYYKQPAKVGKAFVVSSTVMFVYITVAETLAHVLPFFRDQLDTPDPQFLGAKLAVLAIGLLAFALLTLLGYRVSAERFEKLDL